MKLTALFATVLALGVTASWAADRKLVLIAGKQSHPPLMHEFRAGSLLLQKRLNEVPGLTTVLASNGWPRKTVDGKLEDDNSVFEGADAVFIYADGGGGHPAIQGDHLQILGALVKKGVSIGFGHYGVEIPANKGGAEFKEWVGGYYEHQYSVNPIWEPDYQAFPKHPVANGVKPFSAKDEWYFNMRFRDDTNGITPLLVAKPSDAVRNGPYVHPQGPYPHIQANKGRDEYMMWAVERPDGGRGFGFTGGHFHLNWQNESFRRVVLNGLVWLSKLEVPKDGIISAPVSDEEIMLNLDPKGRAKPPVKADAPAKPKAEEPAAAK
jgi:hypothetical protein